MLDCVWLMIQYVYLLILLPYLGNLTRDYHFTLLLLFYNRFIIFNSKLLSLFTTESSSIHNTHPYFNLKIIVCIKIDIKLTEVEDQPVPVNIFKRETLYLLTVTAALLNTVALPLSCFMPS